jgi:uncharacterized protein YdiU (UPF0061 family)
MNTDNMSILGLTIDYGPYGWLEDYDPNWTPNTTDAGQRRYRYGNQSSIGLWNLLQLGNALYPLIEDAEPLEEILDKYRTSYLPKHIRMVSDKLGLKNEAERISWRARKLLYQSEMDMTLFFRDLTSSTQTIPMNSGPFWKNRVIPQPRKIQTAWTDFLANYAEILISENVDQTERIAAMNCVNPKYVLRNYMAQLRLTRLTRAIIQSLTNCLIASQAI